MNLLDIDVNTLTLVNPGVSVGSRGSTASNSTLGELQITTPEGRYVLSGDINFGALGVEEVFQNVKYILLTEYFSVPLDREFGMEYTMVDKPIPIAEAMLSQEVAMKIALYEPRCQFTEIKYEGSGIDGKLNPNVVITILSTDELPSRYPTVITPTTVQVVKAYTYAGEIPGFMDFVESLVKVGPQGPPGLVGSAATIMVGQTITEAPGQPAKVENVGDMYNAKFDFYIPQGVVGSQGIPGTLWFEGPSDPVEPVAGARTGDLYLNTISGDVFKLS